MSIEFKPRLAILLVLMSALSLLTLKLDWPQRADFYFFDLYSKALTKTKEVDPDIAVIAIDDFSLVQMSQHAGKWVWPRSVHAELIEGLTQQSVNALAFDILFAESDVYRPDADAYLNEVIAEANNVYFSMLVLESDSNHHSDLSSMISYLPLPDKSRSDELFSPPLLLPWALTPKYWQLGTINFHAEHDGVGRFYQLSEPIGNGSLNSLALELAKTKTTNLPTNNQILLNWRGNAAQPYPTYSYFDVYQAVITQDLEFLKQFNDKTLLVGATAAGLYDARSTPINQNLPGVYLLATAIDNLINQNYHQVAPKIYVFFLIVVGLLIITFVFLVKVNYALRILLGFVAVLLVGVTIATLSFQMMKHNSVLFIGMPITFLVVHFLLCTFECGYQEFLNRRKALDLFGRFLDPKVVLSLFSQGKLSANSLNKKVPLTMLFSDIRGFTELSEKHSVDEILDLLNNYFNKQVSVVFAENGTLDKFIGDCIMAFWGAPVASDSQADDAISAALTMQENLIEFKQSLPEHLQGFDIGIGIHSGEAIAGLVGTQQRVDYTVIGDAVNLASRIESLTKECSRILISEQTKNLASERFRFEYQGEFTVKGRSASVKLFKPLRK